jgi:hypothetical protein
MKKLKGIDSMYLSQKEYKELCKKIGKPLATEKAQKENIFDSLAEQNFYFLYVVEKMKSGEILKCEVHNKFVLLEDVPRYKLKKKVFKPDFMLTLANGDVFIVEMKGEKIKKLQRDYGLRKHLFIEKYCIPNNWSFIELKSENWTQQPHIEKRKNIFEVIQHE